MSPILRGKVSEVLTKYNFSSEDAQFLANLLQEIDDRQRSEFEQKLDLLLTQKDKTELTERMQQLEGRLTERMQQLESRLTDRMQKDKAELTLRIQQTNVDLITRMTQVESRLVKQVYIVGLIQFLAIVGALIGIINFALK